MNKYLKIGVVVLLLVIGGGTGYAFFGKAPPANSNRDRIAFIGESSFPGLSALLVQQNIYAMNVGLPGLTQVVRGSKMEATLTWSAQGDQIAYFDYSDSSLYAVNADGSGRSELLDQGTPMLNIDWSPDGTKIAYSDGIGGILILDLKTRRTVPLLTPVIEGNEPDWSPNGQQIVFTLNPWDQQSDSSIAIINVDGSELIQLTANDESRSPEWSPDAHQIVFEKDGNIYVMNADGTNLRALSQDGKSRTPSWSPDGTRLIYISIANQKCGDLSFADSLSFCTNELRMMKADGSDVVVVKGEENERYMAPVWASKP